jgi:hypothetical protein
MIRTTWMGVCLASALAFLPSVAFSGEGEKPEQDHAERAHDAAAETERAKRDAAEAAEAEKRANDQQKWNAGRDH